VFRGAAGSKWRKSSETHRCWSTRSPRNLEIDSRRQWHRRCDRPRRSLGELVPGEIFLFFRIRRGARHSLQRRRQLMPTKNFKRLADSVLPIVHDTIKGGRFVPCESNFYRSLISPKHHRSMRGAGRSPSRARHVLSWQFAPSACTGFTDFVPRGTYRPAALFRRLSAAGVASRLCIGGRLFHTRRCST